VAAVGSASRLAASSRFNSKDMLVRLPWQALLFTDEWYKRYRSCRPHQTTDREIL
jgi:hypothetical protein